MRRHSNNFYKKFTKEYLKNQYNLYGTIKKVALTNNVTQGFIRKRMNELKVPYRKKVKYICDEDFFNHNNEYSFYWAGFLAADGNVSKQNDILISLAEKDKGHLYKFKEDIKTDSPVRLYIKAQTKFILGKKCEISSQYKIRFRSKSIAESLKKFNIVPNKTKTYATPYWVTNHDMFIHFIRGYFDGDGWFSKIKYKDKFRFEWGISGNVCVLEDLAAYFEKTLGLKRANITIRKGTFGVLTYSKQHDVLLISKHIYDNANVFLSRKRAFVKQVAIADNQTVILNLDRDEVANLYDSLQSMRLVARELECSPGAVAKYIKKYGIKTPSLKKGERIRKSKRLNINKDILLKLYSDSGSIKAVAKQLSHSPTTIKKYLLEYGAL